MEDIEYISLGKDCCISYHLQRLGLRKTAYPFDWILTKNINDVYKIIENDFKDFLNPLYLEYKNKISDSFLIDEKEEKDQTMYIQSKDLVRVINTKYKVHFMHDFNSLKILHSEYLKSELSIVTEKYTRRIQRFYQVMRDKTKKKQLFYVGKETNLECETQNLNISHITHISHISQSQKSEYLNISQSKISIFRESEYLNSLFIQKGFQNFTFHFIFSNIPTKSWKREEWNWNDFFKK